MNDRDFHKANNIEVSGTSIKGAIHAYHLSIYF